MSVEANLEAAFELANKWREISGQDILNAWIPSVPKKSFDCLLARAINKDCLVSYRTYFPNGTYVNNPFSNGVGNIYKQSSLREGEPSLNVQMEAGSGYVAFNTEQDAKLFAETFGLEIQNHTLVTLPDEIALVAFEFDHGAYQEYAQTIDAEKE